MEKHLFAITSDSFIYIVLFSLTFSAYALHGKHIPSLSVETGELVMVGKDGAD